jgi:transcriptional regulator with XRE-family HTH domain
MAKIDTAWFHQQLEAKGETVRGLGRFMQIDASAASRMLKGERKMSAEEQDLIAEFLGVSLDEVARHRRGAVSGFGEKGQDAYQASAVLLPDPGPWFTEDDIIYKDGKRWMETSDGRMIELHPVFGCMKGTMTIPDDLDLTAPIDVEWSDKLYNE